jgi:uncharacterized protein (TIGR02646 family)
MHKLDRNSVPVPVCLAAPVVTRYDHLHGPERNTIRAALFAIQGERCAYCERRTGTGRDEGHIEHFRDQAGHTHLQLHWPNLFWSCKDESTCGKHKDKCNRPAGTGAQAIFNADEIIDPCVDDPDVYLLFVYDGTVRHRDGLSQQDARRATETIRVFQLADSALLRKSREDAVKPYIGILNSLRLYAPDKLQTYAASELTNTAFAPFSTAIRHFLHQFAQ